MSVEIDEDSEITFSSLFLTAQDLSSDANSRLYAIS